MVDLTAKLLKDATLEQIGEAIKEASETTMKGVMLYVDEEVVSSDFVGTTETSVYDSKACIQISPRFVKLIAWYDNEVSNSFE